MPFFSSLAFVSEVGGKHITYIPWVELLVVEVNDQITRRRRVSNLVACRRP